MSFFFFSSRGRHTRFDCDWSSDVCSADLHVRHELQRVADVLGRRFFGPPLGAAAALGVPAALAASTALASRALLGLHQGKRLPALTGAPLDPAPPIGRNSPVGEQALLGREPGHAAICLAAGLPARRPPALNCRVADGVAAAY